MSETQASSISKSDLAVNSQTSLPGHPTHPISIAVETYMHAARDIKFACKTFLPLAGHFEANSRKRLVKRYDDALVLFDSTDAEHKVRGTKLLLETIRKTARHKFSDVSTILERSLFLSLFSAFDVYTGELLRALCNLNPTLLNTFNRSIPLKDVLSAQSLESLRSVVLTEEIENFRRKSYSEQFDTLEKWFDVKLKKFEKWPLFIEASQRRNLLTHCGGIVSEQYRTICRQEGVAVSDIPQVGDCLGLGADYMLPMCELMMEVALKLGQTLWRKVLPDELALADEHLHDVVYDALAVEQWSRAETFGEFFVTQKKLSSELKRSMAVINLAIALKHLDKTKRLQEIIGDKDWSASLAEFRLAETILRSDYDNAATIMRQIGRKGQILSETDYHTWPLFHGFRDTAIFTETYEDIYGHPFAVKVQESAAQSVKELVVENERAKRLSSDDKNSEPLIEDEN